MDKSVKQLLADHKLSICVDDYGLTPGINQAVIELAQKKKINATSVLVDAPFLSEDYIEQAILLKHKKLLQLGLHLNFTELLSTAQNKALVKSINKHLLLSSFYANSIKEEIYREIERQFYLFKELFDEYPDFIDGHQHVHMLPAFNTALREFYVENRLDHAHIWIRSLNRVNKLNKTNLAGASKLKNLVLRIGTQKARSKSYKYRRELLGVYNFNVKTQDYQNLLNFWLDNALQYIKSTGRGAVIMCHPSVDNSQLDSQDQVWLQQHPYQDPIAEARLVEYNVFKNMEYK